MEMKMKGTNEMDRASGWVVCVFLGIIAIATVFNDDSNFVLTNQEATLTLQESAHVQADCILTLQKAYHLLASDNGRMASRIQYLEMKSLLPQWEGDVIEGVLVDDLNGEVISITVPHIQDGIRSIVGSIVDPNEIIPPYLQFENNKNE